MAGGLCISAPNVVASFWLGTKFKEIEHIWPQPLVLSEDIPPRVRKALDEATKIRDVAPSASVLQSQRAVELMLHEKGLP